MRVKRLDENAILPQRAHEGDLGYDLYALEGLWVKPGVPTKVRTGIAIQFPVGYGAFIKDKSGIASKQPLHVVSGVIDNGYTGEIVVVMMNYGSHNEYITKGKKFCQMVLLPMAIPHTIEEVDDLESSDGRGTGGFGSTGV